MGTKNIPYGGSLPYRKMCRYQSGARLPARLGADFKLTLRILQVSSGVTRCSTITSTTGAWSPLSSSTATSTTTRSWFVPSNVFRRAPRALIQLITALQYMKENNKKYTFVLSL